MRGISVVMAAGLLTSCSVAVNGAPTMSPSEASRIVASALDFWSHRGVNLVNVSTREFTSAPSCFGSTFPVAMFCSDPASPWIGWNISLTEQGRDGTRVDLTRATVDAVSERLWGGDAGTRSVAVAECLMGATANAAGVKDNEVRHVLVHRDAYVRGLYAHNPEVECLFA